MNANELLDIIGEARSPYILEAQKHRAPKRRAVPAKRLLLIAAVITMLVALVGFAAIVFDLDDLILGGYTSENYKGEQVEMDVISLQGYTGSKNYLAGKEWEEYSRIYGTVDDSYVAPRDYDAYLCTNGEMVKKVDELCEKYGLELLGPMTIHQSMWETCEAVGIRSIFVDDALYSIEGANGYHYPGGSFEVEADVVLQDTPWNHPITFEFRNVQKTAFDGVHISVHGDRAYAQWSYTTKNGAELLMALAPDHAMMFCDRRDSFVTVNIPSPQYGEESMDKADLEAFADALCFDFVTNPAAPETVDTPAEIVLYSDYADYISDLLERGAVQTYAIEQVDGINEEELVIMDGSGIIQEVLFIRDGFVQTMASGGSIYLCAYNGPSSDAYIYRVLEQVSDVGGGALQHQFMYINEAAQGVILDVLMECADGSYARSDNGGATAFNWETISQEEYNKLMGQYERLTLDRKYIGEFFGEHVPDFTMLHKAFLPIAGGEVPTDWDSVSAFLVEQGYECSMDEGCWSAPDPMNPDSCLMGDLTTENGIMELADVRYRLTLGDAVREVRAVFQEGGAEHYVNGGPLRDGVRVPDLGELQEFIENVGNDLCVVP